MKTTTTSSSKQDFDCQNLLCFAVFLLLSDVKIIVIHTVVHTLQTITFAPGRGLGLLADSYATAERRASHQSRLIGYGRRESPARSVAAMPRLSPACERVHGLLALLQGCTSDFIHKMPRSSALQANCSI